MSTHYWSSTDSPPRLWLIVGTLFLGLTLEFLLWPNWLVKPLFPDIALLYWAVHQPRTVNFGAAVALGLLMDLAARLPLGFTALAYTMMIALTNIIRGRFSLMGAAGQSAYVFFILACGQGVLLLLETWHSGAARPWSWSYFAPSFVSALLWFFLPVLLRAVLNVFGWRRD